MRMVDLHLDFDLQGNCVRVVQASRALFTYCFEFDEEKATPQIHWSSVSRNKHAPNAHVKKSLSRDPTILTINEHFSTTPRWLPHSSTSP